MSSPVCVDSGIILKIYLDEEDNHLAVALVQSWLEAGDQMVAPTLFPLEITAVLRKQVFQGKISRAYGRDSLQQALDLDVMIYAHPSIHQHAWDIATQLNRPTAYDAHYLALAKYLGCDFWTADRRLYNAAHEQFPWVHCLGELDR